MFHRAFISLADLYAVSGNHAQAIIYLDTLIGMTDQSDPARDAIDKKDVLDAYVMRGVEHTARCTMISNGR